MSSSFAVKSTLAPAAAGLGVTPPSRPADAPRRTVKRAKLWELDHKHHCPVIGTCLPIAELAAVAADSPTTELV